MPAERRPRRTVYIIAVFPTNQKPQRLPAAMLRRLLYLAQVRKTTPIFVLGTGRSGTHWIGQSLDRHPDVRATIETEPNFGNVTQLAINPALFGKLYPRIRSYYQRRIAFTSKPYYLDKTHPCIWITEDLARDFPTARFVAITRNPYATVSSMIKHKGVSAWHKSWRDYPVPNRFLGITPELAETYDDLPLAAQCATRWVAHQDRLKKIQGELGDRLFTVSYEQYAHDPEETLSRLKDFLPLERPIPTPPVKTESLDKWKTHLSPSDIEQILKVTGVPA